MEILDVNSLKVALRRQIALKGLSVVLRLMMEICQERAEELNRGNDAQKLDAKAWTRCEKILDECQYVAKLT